MTAATSELFNPADYFTFVLDQEIRDAGMPGGYCGFALRLAATPDLDRLQQRLDLLVEMFPKASARIELQGKRYAWVATGRRIQLERHQCQAVEDEGEESRRIVLEIFNRPESLPLTVHWIAETGGGTLLLNWLHPLLDARGAKILLDFITSDHPERFQESPSLINAKLAQWSFWKKLQLLFKAKRHNNEANSLDSCLPTGIEQGPQTLKLKVRRFDQDQSRRIAKLAQQTTGLAGRTLYYLGCFMRAMEQVGPPAAKAGYCIPYAFNLRRQGAPTPVLGNHVGCLFARATREQVGDRKGLFEHLLAQHTQAVRDELDLAYLPLMWLGQWLTPARYAKFLRKQHSGGELSSLWFSDLGDMSWAKNGFLGAPVTELTMMCWMTLPPGLALLVGQLDGRLSLSYSYLSPAVDEAWLDQVIARMDAELLENDEA
ncbi:hypothetical protein IVG45_19220 [Methylomonas sp. LL1]|uniref:hypothetical protein n=1 Tax=Methylomonas sp. LL1 TaxID=2785785 RepID=UPI0018C3B897|nr:hypothetical protein [Methylomonas sp. LL1]QPK62929.1 hypothetical protein IVG45_19220 [Methylomonas sp. LL1]